MASEFKELELNVGRVSTIAIDIKNSLSRPKTIHFFLDMNWKWSSWSSEDYPKLLENLPEL